MLVGDLVTHRDSAAATTPRLDVEHRSFGVDDDLHDWFDVAVVGGGKPAFEVDGASGEPVFAVAFGLELEGRTAQRGRSPIRPTRAAVLGEPKLQLFIIFGFLDVEADGESLGFDEVDRPWGVGLAADLGLGGREKGESEDRRRKGDDDRNRAVSIRRSLDPSSIRQGPSRPSLLTCDKARSPQCARCDSSVNRVSNAARNLAKRLYRPRRLDRFSRIGRFAHSKGNRRSDAIKRARRLGRGERRRRIGRLARGVDRSLARRRVWDRPKRSRPPNNRRRP